MKNAYHLRSFKCNIIPETYRNELGYCGKVSGRDEDKIAYRRKFQLSRIAIAFAPSRTDK